VAADTAGDRALRAEDRIHLQPEDSSPGLLRAFETFAPSAPIRLVAAPVHDSVEIDATLAALAGAPGGGLIIVADAFTDANHALLVALAARYRLPAIYPHRFDDALITYGPDLTDLLRRAASYVDRILRGEKPSDLPVQAPTKYELIINLKAAKALGLEVPGHLQQLADEVIE
jgi:putative tryptophan/tyrosine transport system substrate-binding protein